MLSAVNPADWERWRTTGTSGGPPRRSPHRPSLVQQLVDAAQSDDLDAGGDGRSGEVRRWDDDAADFQPAHGICGEVGSWPASSDGRTPARRAVSRGS